MGRVVGLLMVMIAFCLLILALLPSSWLARQASLMASNYLELSVEMEGLQLSPFSLTPTAMIHRLNITRTPDSARLFAREASVGLNLPALLRGDLVLDRLRISDAGLEARVDDQGQGNWQAAQNGEVKNIMSLPRSLLTVKIDDLVLDSFNVHMLNAQFGTELSLDIDGVASTYDAAKLSRGYVKGHVNDQAVSVDAEFAFLGDVLKLPVLGDAPISMDIKAHVGDDELVLKGSVGNPASMSEVDVVFSAQISSLELWQAFVPVHLPDLPRFSLAGELIRNDKDWRLQGLDVQFGQSDFNGEVRADTSSRPVMLDVRLMSEKLAIDQLLQLPELQPLPLPMQFTGRLDYRAEQVASESWPVDDVDLRVVLDEQRLSVLLNRIKLRDGELDGEIIRVLNSDPLVTQIQLNLKRLDLQQLLPASEGNNPRVGQLAARMRLSVAGETQVAMRSSAQGSVISLMTGEWLDTVLQAVLGVELAQALMVERGSSEKAGQACAFLELQAVEGILQLRSLVFDTDTRVYLGDGEIDWNNQSIDLTIEPHFKKVSAGAVAEAVYVSGALSAPVIESVHPFLTRDSAVSVLDATITPAVSLMPFLNTHSDGFNVPCQGIASALGERQ